MSTPRALLLHGVGASRNTWWRATQDLTELGWDVTAVDLPGHGGRPAGAPTVAAMAADVLDQAGDLRFDVLVGHSLGGIVALTAAGLRPGLTRAVLVEDSPGNGGPVDPRDVARDVVQGAKRARRRPGADVRQQLVAYPRWALQDARNATASARAVDTRFVTALLQPDAWNLLQLVEDCPVPVHLLVADGRETSLADPDRGILLGRLGDRATVVESDHCVHRGRPALWLRTVLGAAGRSCRR